MNQRYSPSKSLRCELPGPRLHSSTGLGWMGCFFFFSFTRPAAFEGCPLARPIALFLDLLKRPGRRASWPLIGPAPVLLGHTVQGFGEQCPSEAMNVEGRLTQRSHLGTAKRKGLLLATAHVSLSKGGSDDFCLQFSSFVFFF